MSRWSTGEGQIASAERTCCCAKDARVCAAWMGEVGNELPDLTGGSTLCFLMDSASLFGGPRLLLGLSKVHGMSRATQALHGGPASSH